MGATDAPPTPGLLTTAVLDMQAAYTDAMSTHFFIPGHSFIMTIILRQIPEHYRSQ